MSLPLTAEELGILEAHVQPLQASNVYEADLYMKTVQLQVVQQLANWQLAM